MLLILLILLLFNNRQIDCQESSSILLVDLLQFHNPTGITISGQCCDGSFPSANFCSMSISCNLYTIICLDSIQREVQSNWTSCPLGSKSIRIQTNSTSLFNYYSIANRTQFLPLEFQLPQINDNAIGIQIFVFYEKTTNMLLNRFYTTFRMDVSYPSSIDGTFQQVTLIDQSKNLSNVNQMIVGLKSYCEATFYGRTCSKRCIPNDDCTSSYACNRSTGEKICSRGWSGSDCSIYHGSPTCLSNGLNCHNGGFCRDNRSTCCCPIGFTGSNCQYLSTCTKDVTCLNGGSCHATYDVVSRTSYFVCHCPNGYTGLYCQEKQQCPPTFFGRNCTDQCSAKNSCTEGHFNCHSSGEKICLNGWGPTNLCTQKLLAPIFDPECPVSAGCRNGGSCFNGSCCCPPTYTGRLCEISIDPCTNNPCQNNALCLSTPTGYRCLCSSPVYTGSLCEINQNPCQYSPCQNGICQLLENSNSFSCVCYPGYTGQFCHIKTDHCLSQPCKNNGVCASIATGFVCTCPEDFSGPTCSISMKPCLSKSCSDRKTPSCPSGFTNPPYCLEDINECLLEKQPCKNGGQCVNSIGSYYCRCNEYYQGNDCNIPIDPCSSNPCLASNSVSCTSIMSNINSIDFNCTCLVGFTGNRCEIELNPCQDHPCLNGQCIVITPLSRSCTCEPGWTGLDCEETINECLSNPCLNAGKCIDGENEYQCKCVMGFVGANCQTEISQCSRVPCQNNGTCVNNVDSYSCLCPTGWAGNLCEININECSYPLSCHPNSTCIDLPGSYECICPPWLTGVNCLTAVDQCQTHPCLNDGVCVNNYGRLPTCHCQPGFTGVYCEVNIDDCQAAPCSNNSTCIDQINSFLCLCASGYTGLRCQTRISQCNSEPCYNGGICRDSLSNTQNENFTCLCPPYFTGKQCELIMNPCLSFPCLYGSCIPKIPSYTCQCNSGYTGQNCETMIDQCRSQPCGRHGNCTSLSTRFSCCCAPGFTGLECNQLIDVCSTNPCSIEGVERCVSQGISSFNCLCKPGYSGRYCEININECLSEPCLNGGICVDFQNSYQCICPLIYKGTNCEELQDKCVGVQCLNGGRCINNGTDLNCVCPRGYHGANCELIIDYCQSQPCSNGGICSNTAFGPQCTCLKGITGLLCESIIDQCQSEPCANNGTCKSLIDKYVCLCSDGFLGRQCEIERNECEPVNPCLNSGRCIDRLNNFSCLCNPGFTGHYCESQIDQCQSSPCSNGGICRTLINSFKCDCPQGYTGLTCSSMINHCASNPCSNNGLCISVVNDYRCVCLDDYLGPNCEEKSNECMVHPCLNNGTCVDGVWNYTCQCPSGFTGSNCELEKDYCQSSPCIKGLCRNKGNGYECICPSASYTGINCEIQINKCSSNPCLSGGTCIDKDESFKCICPPWYSGLTCSERLNPCLSQSNCANNASCLINDDVRPYGYTCQCLPGFTGEMCEINVDDCISQPCPHGRCIDQINGFTCHCYPGYDGIFCDNLINQCEHSPCQNNGTCQSLINSYQCHCSTGYHGKNCEAEIIRPCSTNSCFNNGTCLSSTDDDFQCECLHGFIGRKCEIKMNACYSNPCHHGTCDEISNGFYQCLCPVGHTGLNCEIPINQCDSLPCLNHGTCDEITSNGFHCTCPKGYSGTQCQFNDDQCRSAPCLYNGTCVIRGDNYQCLCPKGLTGHRCEIDINECASTPCQNNGLCLQTESNHYRCLCATGYAGDHCETTVNPCLSTHCLNNGTCIRTSLKTGSCSCSPGYTGALCQNQINHCLSAPCLNGTCVPLVDSYQCNCFPGYTGVRCDTVIDYCSSNPCFNNGTCINQEASFACQCPYGFQGERCVIRVQACQSSPCLNGGRCSDVAAGLHNCSCPRSFHGEFCQLRDPFCLEKPCQNNGICLDTLSGYQCVCQGGYHGTNCSHELQPCQSNPCMNDGRCRSENHGLTYQCVCEQGYAGSRCEILTNWCSSNPCQNQGTCLSQLTSFTCLCPSNYTGIICQIPINNCSLTTCQYGVPLVTSPTSCSCVCSNGYTGHRCDIPINPCSKSSFCKRGHCNYLSPGLANCTCPNGYSGFDCDTKLANDACSSCPCLYGECRIINQLNEYVCDCYQGFSGKQCEISIDLCKPSPCLYGQCVLDEMNGYLCRCLPGARGDNCSELIDTCSSNPCSNNGVCIQGLNAYQCVCQPGYIGIHCEILVNQCTSLICLNNGTCVNLPTNPPSAKCQCPSLYTGIQCQYPYAPCASLPCQNLGTCLSDDASTYTCQCPNGFSGKNCEINVQVCDSNPCRNGGTCSEPAPYYYICQCLWPYYGSHCEFMSDPCLSYPCRGPSSKCISTATYQNYTCLCSNYFQGSTCSIPTNPCQSLPCQNNGSCIRTGSLTYMCACQAGYQGESCELEINPCANHSCRNGIAIRTSAISCECQCSPSYVGKLCERNLCQNNPCLVGECLFNGTSSYTCRCPVGFQFLLGVCTDINECRTIPGICQHGGRCLNTYGSYSCFCQRDYHGMNCEIFNPCRSVSCMNNGTCTSIENYPYWQCDCRPHYTGSHCETTLLSCSSDPCRTGTCINLSNDQYQCICPTGITGIHCDRTLLPCDSNPCLNNSTCLTLSLTNFTCVCPPSYSGSRCSEQRTRCSETACEGNATCVIDRRRGEEICQCPLNRYGIHCEFLSPCGSNPCVQGTCENKNETAFECTCKQGFRGKTCDTSFDICETKPCENGGTCLNLGNGLFACRCPVEFTGTDCSILRCTKENCFNKGICVINNNSRQCHCPCGYTGARCEVPFDKCLSTVCQNNGIRSINATTCQCSCTCPPTFTGPLCQFPVVPINRTYSDQIIIPINRSEGSSWETLFHCIDRVWDSVNTLFVCPPPFTLVTPSVFYPSCYRMNQNDVLYNQQQAATECERQLSELVWFQSLDELQEQLIPALVSRGLTRDFWTSGKNNPVSHRWQWLLPNNNTRIDIDRSIITQLGSHSLDRSLYVSFNPSVNQRLTPSSSTQNYSTLCKLPASRLFFNNQTRSISLNSQQTAFINQSEVVIYDFDYKILSSVPLQTTVQQPGHSHYASMCGALSSTSNSVEPYHLDVCGYFSSLSHPNIQLILQAISSYYNTYYISITSTVDPYVSVPLSLEHYLTMSGVAMTRISFVLESRSSITLGSNNEPLPFLNEILYKVPYRSYSQCVPYIPLSILLKLELCIPLNEISSWSNRIVKAVSHATGQSDVSVMFKGVQEGVTTAGRPANIAYFLIIIDGITYDQNNLSLNAIIQSTIERDNEQILCSKETEILLLESSIRNFYSSCAAPSLLENQLNNAFHQAGIYTMTVNIFNTEEVVDDAGQMNRLVNIFFRDINGTWLDSSAELNSQINEIFLANQLQPLTNPVSYLSKSYSYFYSNPLSRVERDYVQRFISKSFNEQSSIPSDNIKLIYEEMYLNLTTNTPLRRLYFAVFVDDQQLDGRFISSVVLPTINSTQMPLDSQSNQIPANTCKQSDFQQITFEGKISRLSAERILRHYWQNPFQQGLHDVNVTIIQSQEYLTYSTNQFYTTITYSVIGLNGNGVSNACFKSDAFEKMRYACDGENRYLAQVPMGQRPSFIDLRGNYSQIDLERDNFSMILTSALQRINISDKVSSITIEPRFGLNMSSITRVYYLTIPHQLITQEQLHNQFNMTSSTIHLYPTEQPSIARSDTYQFIANASVPISNQIRKLSSEYEKVKVVHEEAFGNNKIRLYLTLVDGNQLLTRCDFPFYSLPISSMQNDNRAIHSLYLERSVFMAQSASLDQSLSQFLIEPNLSVQFLDPIQYICSNGKRSVRLDYVVKNASSRNATWPSALADRKVFDDCDSRRIYSLYVTEPRSTNQDIYQALKNAWHLPNSHSQINISSEFFLDSSYLTDQNQTLTRLIYTINSDLFPLSQPLSNLLNLPHIYTSIPYKNYKIYLAKRDITTTTFAQINRALRFSWSKANSHLFSADDVLISSITTSPSDNDQIKVDYIAGLRSDDIGDYAQPSESVYSEIFNETGSETFVYVRYRPRSSKQITLNNNQTSLFPFDYRSGSPFYGLDWWIILIIVVSILAVWLILCVICYACFRKRSTNRYEHKISKRPSRRIDVLGREQDHYLRPSLSSLAFDGPYAESMVSSQDDQQQISMHTISSHPELQVRRLSEQDWPHFAMHNPYGLSPLILESPLHSAHSNRP